MQKAITRSSVRPLKKLVNMEELNADGAACTPLTEAVRTGNVHITRLLLDYEAEPGRPLSDSGQTALTIACKNPRGATAGSIVMMLQEHEKHAEKLRVNQRNLDQRLTYKTVKPPIF